MSRHGENLDLHLYCDGNTRETAVEYLQSMIRDTTTFSWMERKFLEDIIAYVQGKEPEPWRGEIK
jgi:hypothetical protein